jgi:hypothetical protein
VAIHAPQAQAVLVLVDARDKLAQRPGKAIGDDAESSEFVRALCAGECEGVPILLGGELLNPISRCRDVMRLCRLDAKEAG